MSFRWHMRTETFYVQAKRVRTHRQLTLVVVELVTVSIAFPLRLRVGHEYVQEGLPDARGARASADTRPLLENEIAARKTESRVAVAVEVKNFMAVLFLSKGVSEKRREGPVVRERKPRK